MTDADKIFLKMAKIIAEFMHARFLASLKKGGPTKFQSPFTSLEQMIYCDGMNYQPVYWNERQHAICTIVPYRRGNLSMWKFVFRKKENLN